MSPTTAPTPTPEELAEPAPPGRTRDLLDDLADAFGPGTASEVTWARPRVVEPVGDGEAWPRSSWIVRSSRATHSGERGEVALRVVESAYGHLSAALVEYATTRPSAWTLEWADRVRRRLSTPGVTAQVVVQYRRGSATTNAVVAELTSLVADLDPASRDLLDVGATSFYTAALSGSTDLVRAEDSSVYRGLLPVLRDVADGAPAEWALRHAGVAGAW